MTSLIACHSPLARVTAFDKHAASTLLQVLEFVHSRAQDLVGREEDGPLRKVNEDAWEHAPVQAAEPLFHENRSQRFVQ